MGITAMNGLSLLLFLSLFGQVSGPLGSGNNSGAVAGLGNQPSTFSPGGTSRPLGSNLGSNPLTSSAMDSQNDDSRRYGWEINKFNELEYIVQVSPSLLEFMQNPADKQELASQIPPALVGRVKRVVVRIGNETLPRTPLDEIEKLFPALANIPAQKIKDLESSSIVNVNNNANGFPQSGSVGHTATTPLGSQGQGSLLDRFANSGTAISQQGNRFNSVQTPNSLNSNAQNPGFSRLADSRSGTANTQGYVPDLRSNDPMALGNNGYGTAGGYGANTSFGAANGGYGSNSGFGTNGTGAMANNSYGTNPNTSYANGTNGNYGYGSGTQANGTYANNQYPQNAPYRNDVTGYTGSASGLTGSRLGTSPTGYPNELGYNQQYNQGQNPNYNSLTNGQYLPNRQGYGTTTTGFGDSYGQMGNPLYDPRRGAGSSYTDMNGLGPASGYLASTSSVTPRTDLPSTTAANSDRNLGYRTNNGQHSNLQAGGYPSYQTAENYYFFYVFFILSIAVNLWLVHLLRSLYLRYRNLLSSLRSQATTTLG